MLAALGLSRLRLLTSLRMSDEASISAASR